MERMASAGEVGMPTDGRRGALLTRIGDRIFYGWVMVAVAALGFFASGPGQSHMFSVFIGPISQDLGLARTEIASAYALATLVAAFGLPYVGRLIDRHGVRKVVLVVASLLGLAAIGFGQVTSLALLTLGFGALRFLGQGSMMLSSANLVAQWFSRRRGFALSLMALGFSASIALHPPAAQWLIDQVGWREAWFWLGLSTWLLVLPAVALLVHDKPEDVGLRPDGASVQDRQLADSEAEVGLTSREALRAPAFWVVAASLATFSALVTALFFYQVSIFAGQGLPVQTAASIFPVSAICMVLAVPVFGRLVDRLPTQPMFAAAMLTMCAPMLFAQFVHDLSTAVIYAVLFGINNAAIHAHISYVWPRFFGRRHLGSIQGTAQTIGVLGASVGPLPFGVVYDLTGSFALALNGLAVLPALCALAILVMRPPRLGARPATADRPGGKP
jgi:MFS family permease